MGSTNSSADPNNGFIYRELASIHSNLLKRTDRAIIYTDESGTEVFVITGSDIVYSFGRNYYGRLGFGHSLEVKEPTIIQELSGKSVIDIKCGNIFSVALTQSGQIYTFGTSFDGRTGNGFDSDDCHKPIEISVGNHLIDAIDCMENSTHLLTKSGRIYSFGYSVWDKSYLENPVLMPLNMKIKSMSCGSDHILVLTLEGKVFSWGRNTLGQLGLGDNYGRKTPQMIDFSDENIVFKQVSCGENHSLLLTTDGNVYSMGCNKSGQLGIGTKDDKRRPQRVLLEEKQKQICCYENISMSLDLNNKLFIWGNVNGNQVIFPLISGLTSFQEVVNTYGEYRRTLNPLTSDKLFRKTPLISSPIETNNSLINKKPEIIVLDGIESNQSTHKFNCSFLNCDYKTGHKWNLKKHELLHKTVGPFKCDGCPLSFRQLCQLKSHRRVHQ